MKKHTPFLLLAAAAFGFASCTTTASNTAMVPLRSVEEVERQSPVTHNPNGLSEALGARTAAQYGQGGLFNNRGGGFGYGIGL